MTASLILAVLVSAAPPELPPAPSSGAAPAPTTEAPTPDTQTPTAGAPTAGTPSPGVPTSKTAPAGPSSSETPASPTAEAPTPAEPAPQPKRPPRAKPTEINRSADLAPPMEESENEAPNARLMVHGEWYVPDAYDASLEDSGKDPWTGPYRAVELRTMVHGFMGGPARGRYGTQLNLRLDLSAAFGLDVGTLFSDTEGGVILGGLHLFGNYRVRIADFRRVDASLGLVFPELSLQAVYVFPDNFVAKVGVQLLGLRLVFADLFQITARGGFPSFWATLPQAGTTTSWSVAIDTGIVF